MTILVGDMQKWCAAPSKKIIPPISRPRQEDAIITALYRPAGTGLGAPASFTNPYLLSRLTGRNTADIVTIGTPQIKDDEWKRYNSS
jgi:hypothetical protein